MITTNCYSQNGILDVYLERSTTSKELIMFLNTIEKTNSFSRFLNIIIKIPEDLININSSHLPLISKSIIKAVKKYDNVNIALTVSNERDENLLYYLRTTTSEFNYQIELFKSIKDAMRWLRRNQLKVFSEYNSLKAG